MNHRGLKCLAHENLPLQGTENVIHVKSGKDISHLRVIKIEPNIILLALGSHPFNPQQKHVALLNTEVINGDLFFPVLDDGIVKPNPFLIEHGGGRMNMNVDS